MKNLLAEDLFRFSFLSRLKFSPSGKKLAFLTNQCNPKDNKYDSALWLWDGRELSELEDARGGQNFIWLSDEEILFSALRGEGLKERAAKGEKLSEFHLLSLKTARSYPAFTLPVTAVDFSLFDGGLVLLCKYSRGEMDFSVMSAEQKEQAYAALKAEKDYQILDELPFWANGGGFTNGQRPRLYTCNLNGGALQPITSETTSVGGYKVIDGQLYFHATDFISVRSSTEGIFRFDPASRQTETLLPDGEYAVRTLDKVDGRLIFAGISREQYSQQRNAAFYEVLPGGSAALLYDGDEAPGASIATDVHYGSNSGIVSAPDGIYYSAVEDTRNVVKRLRPGCLPETLFDSEGAVSGLAVSGGQIAWVGMKGIQLEELYLTEGGQTRQISDFNGWVGRERLLSVPHPVTAYSNGDTISGFYLEPVRMEEGKKYPVILDIHGGPKGAYGSVYVHEMQCWANQGYFVFFCNPHGSEGRGYRFADIRGRYGWEDYEDIMTFVDTALAACPQADPDRMGVTGGSYGGFMTNWIIGHTDRFKAAASQRSISNWITSILTCDIGYTYDITQVQATPWSDAAKIWDHSPAKFADKAKTPTLFIHSDEDYRCWMAEGIQMFTSLKMHGVDARLCLFHGENHELSRSGKPTHRLRRLNEIQDWMDKYLK